jgi:acetolactate synthase-1/2/3 large subunit
MPNTVEVLVEAFQNAGTPFLAGIPGEQATLDMIEAARKRGMRFILVKHETAGALLASTWGEITGSPGVCLSTRSPGAASMVNGVAHAWLDRCPLIAITDRYAAPAYLTGSHMRLDQTRLYESITKWNTTIDARTVRQQVRRAIRTATAHAPGPVHLDMPASEKSLEAGEYVSDAPLTPDHAAIVPDRSALKTALDMLKGAKRPILLVGLGVLWTNSCAEMVALAERLGAPVLTTAKCKGTIPEDHPLSTGCIRGGALERKLVSEADVIVTVGLDAVELHAAPWPYSAPVLALSSVTSLDGEIPFAAEVVGDLKAILDGLSKWAPEGASWGERAARAFREGIAAQLDTPSKGLSPQRLFDVARSVLPRDTIATVDAGASHSIGAQKWLSYGPKEFLASNGLATMGYAVPAAMAARIVHPERPVVAFCGDGGFLVAPAELQTSVRENLPIVVVVLDDGELGAMRVRQDLRGMQRYGTQLGGIDWEHLARGFGADGTVVDTEKALGDALGSAMRSRRTTLIAARMDTSGYVDQFRAMWGKDRDAS